MIAAQDETGTIRGAAVPQALTRAEEVLGGYYTAAMQASTTLGCTVVQKILRTEEVVERCPVERMAAQLIAWRSRSTDRRGRQDQSRVRN